MNKTTPRSLALQFRERVYLWPMLVLRFMLGINLLMTARFWILEQDRAGSLVRQITPRLEAGHTISFYEHSCEASFSSIPSFLRR